jgi:hypothetical protein
LLAGALRSPESANAAGLAGAQTLAVDADTTGNTATSIGPIDGCNTIAQIGGTLDVDVVVDSIPAMSNPGVPTDGQGLSAFSYDFTFDPNVVSVTASSASFLLSVAGAATPPANLGESPPDDLSDDTPGDYQPGWADLSTDYDSGAGVLERITLTAVGTGTTDLSIKDDPGAIGNPAIADSNSNQYTINHKLDATIVVGGTCPEPTPTPAGTERLWGDIDCGGSVALGDAIGIARHLVSLNVNQQAGCPDLDNQHSIDGTLRFWADIDCNGSAALGDAIGIARHLVSLPVNHPFECPDPEDHVIVGG